MSEDKKCAECGATGELTRFSHKGKHTAWRCAKCTEAAMFAMPLVAIGFDGTIKETFKEGEPMSTGTSINLQGTVHKTIVKPPKLNDDGFVESQEVEIVLRIPLADGMRQKLADLSRLQNGQTTYIALHDVQFNFDTTGDKPETKAPKAKKSKKAGEPTFTEPATA
jgi:hypothetical protein